MSADLYHMFMIDTLALTVEGKWEKGIYNTEGVFNDQEFDEIMALVHWYMPFRVHAYHFHSNDGKCHNPIVNCRQSIPLSIPALFSSKAPHTLKLKDKIMQKTSNVLRKADDFVLQETEDGYGRVLRVDGTTNCLISPMYPVPLAFRQAKEYVQKYHRHNEAPQGHKFSIGIKVDDEKDFVGVVIASIPKAAAQNDGVTLEINRCCSNPCYSDVCSKLYGLAIRAGKSMGYRRFITYTLPTESGSSTKASGFHLDGVVSASPHGWDTPSRPRRIPDRYPSSEKLRWVLNL